MRTLILGGSVLLLAAVACAGGGPGATRSIQPAAAPAEHAVVALPAAAPTAAAEPARPATQATRAPAPAPAAQQPIQSEPQPGCGQIGRPPLLKVCPGT